MKFKPVSRSKYPKWSCQDAPNHVVSLEFRPLLDKWDVVSLPQKYHGIRNWYMYQKSDRFSTKLEALLFILKRFSDGSFDLQDRYTQEYKTYTLKELEMTEKAVAQLTLVFGKDSRFVSDEEIYAHIKRLEDEVKKLNSIEHKPKKLQSKIESIKKDIEALATLVDSR